VNARLNPAAFTIKTAPSRMKRLREDPLAPVLQLRPDLPRALALLEGEVGK
jgi:bifunctional non-homologous end joining protein LigD